MFDVQYNKFKQALIEAEARKFEELKQDIKQVEAFIEQALTAFFECSSSKARTTYSGIDL